MKQVESKGVKAEGGLPSVRGCGRQMGEGGPASGAVSLGHPMGTLLVTDLWGPGHWSFPSFGRVFPYNKQYPDVLFTESRSQVVFLGLASLPSTAHPLSQMPLPPSQPRESIQQTRFGERIAHMQCDIGHFSASEVKLFSSAIVPYSHLNCTHGMTHTVVSSAGRCPVPALP